MCCCYQASTKTCQSPATMVVAFLPGSNGPSVCIITCGGAVRRTVVVSTIALVVVGLLIIIITLWRTPGIAGTALEELDSPGSWWQKQCSGLHKETTFVRTSSSLSVRIRVVHRRHCQTYVFIFSRIISKQNLN